MRRFTNSAESLHASSGPQSPAPKLRRTSSAFALHVKPAVRMLGCGPSQRAFARRMLRSWLRPWAHQVEPATPAKSFLILAIAKA